jgi:hypothetical protein
VAGCCSQELRSNFRNAAIRQPRTCCVSGVQMLQHATALRPFWLKLLILRVRRIR